MLALTNSFNEIGIDHVILVRIASAALADRVARRRQEEVINAVSQALLDGGNLRAYRHVPDAGPRKSWAAGDATARGVRLALLTLAGEPGYAHVLSAPATAFTRRCCGENPEFLPRAELLCGRAHPLQGGLPV